MSNRVAVDKPLNVRSVNGPQFTTIDGGYWTCRCVYLTNGASLSGFTLTNGLAALLAGGGGGVCVESIDCGGFQLCDHGQPGCYPDYFYGNHVGGGAYGGTLNNCTLTGNSARADAELRWRQRTSA